jgi:type I restriction enzyme S subunit
MENKIPKGWEKVKLGDVVEHVKDKVPNRDDWTFDRYIGGEHFDEGEIRIIKSAPIEGNEEVIGSAFHMRFKPGQVLYVTRNPRLRKGGMVDFEGVCSNVTFTLQANENKLSQKLLPFIIQTESFTKHACNSAHGSTNPFLNWKDIASYDLLLPPISEQKKIAEILWAIEQNIILLQNLNNKTINIRDKMLNNFIGDNLKFTVGENGIKNSKEWIKISDFIEVNPIRSIARMNNARCVNMADLKEDEPKICSSEIRLFKGGGSKFQNEDTLFSRITPCLENGKIAYVDILNKDETAWGSTEFIILSGKKEISLNKWVYYLATTPLFKNEAVNSMIGTSGRQRVPNSFFDKVLIKNIEIKEQKHQINLFDKLSMTIKSQEIQIKSLKALRQKLTNELLSGKIKLD